MRKADTLASLDSRQAAIADTGVKALIPIKRPFLDYVLTVLADAGFRRICLVIGPEHDEIRRYYTEQIDSRRLRFDFAIQEKPLGTANAVAAAETFAGGDPFLMVNSDNFYPLVACRALRQAAAPAVALFERDAMLSGSNIPPERLRNFAVGRVADGLLRQVIEKPSAEVLASLGQKVYLSMNLWWFDHAIFDACRAIPPSPRGEYEITDAVQYAIDSLGSKYAARLIEAPVLDLSSRADVGPVTERLESMEVSL
jgi:glucose-1-phosphate thymidylyltransferase